MVSALRNAESILMQYATCVASEAKRLKNLPVSIKKGAPGGWPTSSLNAVVMNSGQSQKLAVGSMVSPYVT